MRRIEIRNNSFLSRVNITILAFSLLLLTVASVTAQDEIDPVTELIDSVVTPANPAPPTDITVKDTPNDAGGSITIRWALSADDATNGISKYRIMRQSNGSEFTQVGEATAGAGEYLDGQASDEHEFNYKVLAISEIPGESGETIVLTSESVVSEPISSSAQWFDSRRVNVLVVTAILVFFILWFIQRAKSGEKLFIRKIAGLEAVDEAVGRATEMGKKIFYVPGINDMDNVQTIASMTILGRVAELAGQYDTWLEVPVCRSLVMVTAKEVVKEAYTKVGRPDSYHEDQVHYLTDDQFGYAAAIDGMVVREKPATIFYMGAFFAESLILAETGNASGAIQIAGTAMPAQLPFFVTACDYTLIGEELFAASAYLSKEPKLLGSLKGQDYGKGAILIAILIGVLLETFGIWELSQIFSVIE